MKSFVAEETRKPGQNEQTEGIIGVFSTFLIFTLTACSLLLFNQNSFAMNHPAEERKTDTITFGAGCFWCVEAIFERVHGVKDVRSGYSGGTLKNPGYKEVCTGITGHAEVCQVVYYPDDIRFLDLLEIFWKTHDPTTLNRQGNDIGTQYRSAIFYHTEEQKEIAVRMKQRLEAENIWPDPIVTEITPFETFYPAEAYHEDYYENNPNQSYCRVVITPKVEKFEKAFRDFLR